MLIHQRLPCIRRAGRIFLSRRQLSEYLAWHSTRGARYRISSPLFIYCITVSKEPIGYRSADTQSESKSSLQGKK